MQYLLAIQNDESLPPPTEEVLQATVDGVARVSDEMVAAGVWVFAAGLLPSDRTTVVRVDDGTTTMTDGPFAETKEQIGGLWVIRAPDLASALVWAEKCAEVCRGPIEVRPLRYDAQHPTL
ncbi:YciI family protein [Pseudonocardia sp. TRM90224]|uniref:YciI family protein n=1 Tax=Pseudonocardia sp. TRM90224 TaxID=2812678 RepID=UPI001E3C4776|nr:YciI family protein [Pseudonocardia sp. TRM90224]